MFNAHAATGKDTRTVENLLAELGKVVVGDGLERCRVDGEEDGGIGCGPLNQLRARERR